MQGRGAILVAAVHMAAHADESADQLGLPSACCEGQGGQPNCIAHIHLSTRLA